MNNSNRKEKDAPGPGSGSGHRFLFSIDLEDVRTMIPGGESFEPRVLPNTRRWLEFLQRHGARATFFTVGNVARQYPELIREIAQAGHELATHTSNHEPLYRQDAASLREDLRRNRNDLEDLTGLPVVGFRAPVFSITEKTLWAYEVLAELGFCYSSSVLPQKALLAGWADSPREPTRKGSGVWEVPLSLGGVGPLCAPFAGGVYFRLSPQWLSRFLFRAAGRRGEPVISYFHPYDLDTEQERFQHPELGGSRVLNSLMFIGRRSLVSRLDRLITDGLQIERYADYVRRLDAGA